MVKKSKPGSVRPIPTGFGSRLPHNGLDKGLGQKVRAKTKPESSIFKKMNL